MKTPNLGTIAEEIATQYLLSNGYTILERNLKVHQYEIDIISELDPYLVVVEVKARTSKVYGTAREHLKADQLRRIFSAYEYWARKKNMNHRSVRFDLIEYYPKEQKLIHLMDAFRE